VFFGQIKVQMNSSLNRVNTTLKFSNVVLKQVPETLQKSVSLTEI